MAGSAPRPAATDLDDQLAYAVAIALGDLLVYRGDDAVAAAVLLVALDPRGTAWFGATVRGSRPLRVAAAGTYLLQRVNFCSGSCVGVSAGGGPSRPPPAQLPTIEPARGAASCQVAAGSSQAKHVGATGVTLCAARRVARARQARGRSVAVCRAGLAFVSRGLAATLPAYPAEAAVALYNSVQADELDDRCAVSSTDLTGDTTVRAPAAPRGRLCCLGAGPRAVEVERRTS